MYTKRASLLTIRSLTALTKVCSSRHSCGSVKTLDFLKSLSTATEISDFQNLNGYNVDSSSQYGQNPSEIYAENQSSMGFQQIPNQGPRNHNGNGQIGQNGNYSGYENNYGDLTQNSHQNSSGGYRESLRSEYQNNIGDQNGKFNGYYGRSDGNLKQNASEAHVKSARTFEQNSNLFYQNHGGVYRESTRNEYQNNKFQQNGNLSGSTWNSDGQLQNNTFQQNGNLSGSTWNNDGDLKQNASEAHVKSARTFEQNSNQFYQNHGGVYRESTRNEYQNNTFQQNGNLSESTWNSDGQLQQSPDGAQAQKLWGGQYNLNGYHGGDANTQNQFGSVQEGPGLNPNGFNSHGLPGRNGDCMQNVGQYQHISSDNYTRNVGVSQNSPNVYQQNRYAGQYQQNPDIGQYQPNSNGIQNGMVASQVLTNSTPVGESAEASESSQNNATIEELDGFIKEGKVNEAVEVLGLLEKQCFPVDLPRLLQLMRACGEAKALQEAKAVHEHIVRSQSPLKVSTYNRILKMYSECGSMDDAFIVFNSMRERNLTSWDTMITWLAKNSLGEDAVDLFSQFKQTGMKPDGHMFIGVYAACGVLGDVDEGMLHFESMSKDYGIVPSMKHYVSLVDMLGNTGYLDEALEFIEKMPLEPSVDVWETLMNFCRIHGNMELGDRCAELVEQLDPSRLNEKSKAGLIPVEASDLAKEKEKKNLASQNLLEVRSKVHEYRAGDTSHPETDKIYAQIRGLKAQMKEAGYIPETRFVLHDIDQEGKEEALLAHSERLAVSHGLLSSPARSPIRIIKNLRVCGDCHTALKIISKIVGRELIIRDAKRFHHFKEGLCSCRDYW